jgi:hypothetical protein
VHCHAEEGKPEEGCSTECDRIVGSRDERARRSLGVLVNPPFGFSAETRPVYSRILAIQDLLLLHVLGRDTRCAPFESATLRVAMSVLDSASLQTG